MYVPVVTTEGWRVWVRAALTVPQAPPNTPVATWPLVEYGTVCPERGQYTAQLGGRGLGAWPTLEAATDAIVREACAVWDRMLAVQTHACPNTTQGRAVLNQRYRAQEVARHADLQH